LRYSVDRAAIELLYRPLPTRDVFEGKTFIDAIVCRCGDAAGVLLALFASAVLHVSFRSLGVLTIPLVLAWMLAAHVAQRAYRARLLDDLRHETSRVRLARRGRPAFATGPSAGANVVSLGILHSDPKTRLRILGPSSVRVSCGCGPPHAADGGFTIDCTACPRNAPCWPTTCN
jgi:hypothetical protein